jgi:hypothetical protein
MSRVHRAAAVLLLSFVALGASAAPSFRTIEPSVVNRSNSGTIVIRTEGWAGVECGPCTTITVLVDGEPLPPAAVSMAGIILRIQPPAHAAGAADLELRTPVGNAFAADALLFVDGDDYETVLLPLTGTTQRAIAGAFGSQWKTATSLRNDSQYSFRIAVPYEDPGLLGPSPGPFQHVIVPAQSTSRLDLALTGPLVVRVPRPIADQVAFQTRAFDDSRGELNFGTRVPSVRRAEFHRSRITIADVSTAPPFRASLRIYSPDQKPRAFHVTLSTQPNIVALPSGQSPAPPPSSVITQFTAETAVPFHLAIYEVSKPYAVPFADILLPTLGERFQVSVEPVDDGDAPFYAFVSVTNNSTQHVTLLTPH